MISQLDYLDQVAQRVVRNKFDAYRGMSTGERLYVALAASRSDLLEEDGYTIAEAMTRIGSEWRAELIQRWQYVSHAQLRADSECS